MIILQRVSIVSGVLAVDINRLSKRSLCTVKHLRLLKQSVVLAQTLTSELF